MRAIQVIDIRRVPCSQLICDLKRTKHTCSNQLNSISKTPMSNDLQFDQKNDVGSTFDHSIIKSDRGIFLLDIERKKLKLVDYVKGLELLSVLYSLT